MGLPTLVQVAKDKKKPKTYVEERLQGTQRVPVVAGEGRGRDGWRNGRELHQVLAKPKRQKYDRSTMCTTRRKMRRRKKKRELGMHDLPCAHSPRIMRGQNNNTGAPRVWGSDGRRFCLALPARILERRATSTGRSLRHEALVNSGPYAGAAARTPRQCMIGLGPDHVSVMTSLLRARRQQLVIATPLRAGVATVGSVLRRKTLGPLRAPTWKSTHPVPPPLPGRVDHHKVAHRLRPRALLVALGPETHGLLCRRRVATVARRCGREVEDRRNVDCLYRRLACVQCTTGMDDVANGRRRKRTTSRALRGCRASHPRATPTEDRDDSA